VTIVELRIRRNWAESSAGGRTAKVIRTLLAAAGIKLRHAGGVEIAAKSSRRNR